MKLDDFLRFFPDVQITSEQMAACRFLESIGLRFCIDFGYENAFETAFEKMAEMDAFVC